MRKVFRFLKRSAKAILGPAIWSRWAPIYWRFRRMVVGNEARTVHLQRRVKRKFKIGMAVLAHERPEYLELCLDSLFHTKLYDYNITFLIQDDGSKDPRVRAICERQRDPRYKIIRSFTPKGHNSWGAAFNKAMRRLLEMDDFDIVGSCDADALFHPEWLDQTMKVCLWAKRHHKCHKLGPFSSFNSSNADFHGVLGTYTSPFGKYVVKRRMGALNVFYFKKDLLTLGFFQEDKNDETLMTERFEQLQVRNVCTKTSYIEHMGRISVLDQWRPMPVGSGGDHAVHRIKDGWLDGRLTPQDGPFIHTNRTLVIQLFWGGLGDYLFHSHIPRIAKETGKYDKVFISNASAVRHPDNKRVVWDLNPFVDGWCDDLGMIGSVRGVHHGMNVLDVLMLDYGLEDGKRYHEPEVYYQPKALSSLMGKTVYDPNYVSNAGTLTANQVAAFMKEATIGIDYQMSLRDKSIPIKEFGSYLSTRSLEEFCDVISSCQQLICLVTGTATLAAALGKSATVVYGTGVKEMFLHSRLHDYVFLGERHGQDSGRESYCEDTVCGKVLI